MTVKELAKHFNLTVFSDTNDREVTSFYCCDVLSNALLKLKKDGAWFTVVNNVNVAAVAFNNSAACIILTEGIKPDALLLERAIEYGVSVLGSNLDTYHSVMMMKEIF